jgi:hypothetical protein
MTCGGVASEGLNVYPTETLRTISLSSIRRPDLEAAYGMC